MEKFPLRQVHLDFHTSPDIGGIGSRCPAWVQNSIKHSFSRR